MRIDGSELVAFGGRMAGAQGVIRGEMLSMVDRLTVQGEGFAKSAAPVRTGHLRRSITASGARFAGGTATGTYGTATPYAPHVEYGRGPVAARAGGMLRFTIGNRVLFRRRVGPAAPRPFMRPSVARLRPYVQSEGRAMLGRVIVQLGGGG